MMMRSCNFSRRFASTHTTSKLLIAVSDLEKDFNIKLGSFPNLIVVGPQSSGKTSLVEGLCGDSIFPKKMDMATKKPFNITTIRSDVKKFKIRGKTIFSEAEARELMLRLNDNSSVPAIDVEVHGPDKYNARFTDLPGLYYVDKQNKDQPRVIREMNEEHIAQPNNVPIVVSSASSDAATNQAIQLVNDLNRDGDALGVLTKVDLTSNQNTDKIRAMLAGELPDYELGAGWIATVLRNKKEVDAGMTVAAKEEWEKKYFSSRPEFTPNGINTVRQRISDLQFNRIKDNLPSMLSEIEARLVDLEHSGSFLSKILDDPKGRLAGRLQLMIEKLVGSSLERAEFEEALRADFSEAMARYVESALGEKDYQFELSKEKFDHSIVQYHNKHHSRPKYYTEDHFGDLFRYGLVSPLIADNDAIATAFEDEASLAVSVPLLKFYKDDPLGKKRSNWNKSLSRFFNALLDEEKHDITKDVYDITESRVLEYIKKDTSETDTLTHKFAEYIVKEIGSAAYEENIKFSILAMIKTEKRPNISLVELTRELSKMSPELFTFTGGMFESLTHENRRLAVEVYGQQFNDAYLRAVAMKLGDNVYRNVAVNLLDNMVRSLLEMTIDLFNQETVELETKKVQEKITKLKETREILKHFAE